MKRPAGQPEREARALSPKDADRSSKIVPFPTRDSLMAGETPVLVIPEIDVSPGVKLTSADVFPVAVATERSCGMPLPSLDSVTTKDNVTEPSPPPRLLARLERRSENEGSKRTLIQENILTFRGLFVRIQKSFCSSSGGAV